LRYSEIADVYDKIESTTKRLEMTNLLVEFLRKTPKNLVGRVSYLTQGKLYPDFSGIKMGVEPLTSAKQKSTAY
jgi:DNA ligase-1